MGLDYKERIYYDDPQENEDFINVYGAGLYCSHGQPCYYTCYKCKREAELKHQKKYHRSEINENLKTDIKEPQFNKLKKSNSFEELKKEYYKLCKVFHPDKGGDEETFKQLNNLYHDLETNF